MLLAKVAQDTKAQDVQVLQVGHMVSWTSYFVIATVTSQPQMTAVLAKVAREAKEKLDWAALRPVDGRCGGFCTPVAVADLDSALCYADVQAAVACPQRHMHQG